MSTQDTEKIVNRIKWLTDAELNSLYKENKNARKNNTECVIQRSASIKIEIMLDQEISRRATLLLSDMVTKKLGA
jgi:hypothetical protein